MWRAWLLALADAFFPPTCLLCGREAWEDLLGPLCASCAGRLPPPVLRCTRCGRPAAAGWGDQACPRCQAGPGPGPIARVLAGLDYRQAARELVLALKFGGRRSAARVLGQALAEAVLHAGVPADLVVSVPLSRRRQRERGYNQAHLIARHVARAVQLPLAGPRALQKRRHLPRQSELAASVRRRAARGAYVAEPAWVHGRCILLVDDVLTSGATARACALALRRAGAARVSVAVACRAASQGRQGL